jgi:TIGR03009 family protein
MWHTTHRLLSAWAAWPLIVLLIVSAAAAQQRAAPQAGGAPLPSQRGNWPAATQPGAAPVGQLPPDQPAAQPPVQGPPLQQQPPQPPPGFNLDQIRAAQLDLVLDAWQAQSANVTTFRCPFERREYNRAFGPHPNIPLFVNEGEVSFEKPDKGSFQITLIKKWTWQDPPAQPGQAPPAERKGNYQPDPTAVGEHWVCDGRNIYEYRHDQKHLVVRPIPPQLQGKAIVDGPLPFLFGAEKNKVKLRYWLRLDEAHMQQNPKEVRIVVLPKFQADAANYSQVDVVLDKDKMLPTAMMVQLPNRDYNIYIFDLTKAKINSKWEQIKSLFAPPELPRGWKRVEEPAPIEQAVVPQGQRR